jgi:hypothetical protein
MGQKYQPILFYWETIKKGGRIKGGKYKHCTIKAI